MNRVRNPSNRPHLDELVVGQPDVELLLDPRKNLKSLQAVHAEALDQVVIALEL